MNPCAARCAHRHLWSSSSSDTEFVVDVSGDTLATSTTVVVAGFSATMEMTMVTMVTRVMTQTTAEKTVTILSVMIIVAGLMFVDGAWVLLRGPFWLGRVSFVNAGALNLRVRVGLVRVIKGDDEQHGEG